MAGICSEEIRDRHIPGSDMTADNGKGRIRITIMEYDENQLSTKDIEPDDLEGIFPSMESGKIRWINVEGLGQSQVINRLGQYINTHPETLEDIVNVNNRPKVASYDNYIYVIAKMLYYNSTVDEMEVEQVSFILGHNYVVTFQEREGDVFQPIRDKLGNSSCRLRKMGADYLLYSLIDAIVDYYFVILESVGEKIEDAEYELISAPSSRTLKAIHCLKRELTFLRKAVWPLRGVISSLERAEYKLINPLMSVYMRDLYEHTIQIIDNVEVLRDILSGMLDIYLSSVSNKTNEIMKILTIMTTLFIPLTFITGLYGMNFTNMPELKWKLGYYAALSVMVLITIAMVLFFRKKKWI